MIVEQYYLSCLSQASYLIGDEEAGVAALVDPRRDVDEYLAEAEKRGLEIRHVLLTHFHADFVSGHLELAERTGATIHIGAAGKAEYEVSAMADGDELELGKLRIRALATPGHTPESTCFLLFDTGKSEDVPHCVFTGDTLFIGDVGRPDLLSSVGITAEELAGQLYDSLRQKLLPLADEVIVYPGHGAGSACGKNLSSDTWSTIGNQRELNYALQPMEKAEFVAMVTANQPTAPAYFGYDAGLNKRKHELLSQAVEKAMKPLTESQVDELVKQGAQVLDVRTADSFAASHRKGSTFVGIDGRFASWAGTVLDLEAPIVVIADAGREEEAMLRLGRIGLDNVAGFLDGGTHGLSRDLQHFERLDVRTLSRRLDQAEAPVVLDVRGPGERVGAHIAGSMHIPLPELRERIDEVPRDQDVVCVCAGGYRSVIAASLLQKAEVPRVFDMRGGMGAWQAAELPVIGEGASCAA